MALEDLFAELQPVAGASLSVEWWQNVWENVNQWQTTNEYDNMFQNVPVEYDWKQVPKTEWPKDIWVFEQVKKTVWELADVATEIPQGLYDWWEWFFSNKKTSKGITNLEEYNRQIWLASTDEERRRTEQNLLSQWILTKDYFNQTQESQNKKIDEDQIIYQKTIAWFKNELTSSVKDYLKNADKMQQKYIQAAIESQANQYGKLWTSINESYDWEHFNRADYFKKLNNEIAWWIKDTVRAFSSKIMEWKDSKQAYDELVPVMKSTFSDIAQFWLDVWDKSVLSSREHFYWKMSWDNPMAILWYASWLVQEATQDLILKPTEYWKQTLLSQYDVTEDLKRLWVYNFSDSAIEKGSAWWDWVLWNVISWAPQIATMLPVMVSEWAIAKIPSLAQITKWSKIKTALWEFTKDTLLYNWIVQAALWRWLTEKDIAENFLFDWMIDSSLWILEAPIKKDIDNLWLNKYWKQFDFNPSEKVSQDVMDLWNKWDFEWAKARHLTDVASWKEWDIDISSLDNTAKEWMWKMQNDLKQTVESIKNNSHSYKEWVLISEAIESHIKEESSKTLSDRMSISWKIADYVSNALSNWESDLAKKYNFSAVNRAIEKWYVSKDTVLTYLDDIAWELKGTNIWDYRPRQSTIDNIVTFAKDFLSSENAVSTKAISNKKHKGIYDLVINELYKKIVSNNNIWKWKNIWRYVVQDNWQYLDRLTKEVVSNVKVIWDLDKKYQNLLSKNNLSNIVNNLWKIEAWQWLLNTLGLDNIIKEFPELQFLITELTKKANFSEWMWVAKLSWTLRNIIDWTLNLQKLEKEDLSIIKLIMIPWLVKKWKTTTNEIVKDNAWKLWDWNWNMILQNANIEKASSLVKNVIKDWEPEDVVETLWDIVSLDKNITTVKKSWDFNRTLSNEIKTIPNETVRNSAKKTLINNIDSSKMSTIEKAKLLWVNEKLAEDKALHLSTEATPPNTKQEFSDWIVEWIARKKLNIDKNIKDLPIGWGIIWWVKVPPREIKTYKDQNDYIEEYVRANWITENVMIERIQSSIWIWWVQSFTTVTKKIDTLLDHLISLNKWQVKLMTNNISDISAWIKNDIKVLIQEADNIKAKYTNPEEAYKNLLQLQYEYRKKLYTYLLENKWWEFSRQLYSLIQTLWDTRFVSAIDTTLDKFKDLISSELLSIEIDDIRMLKQKTFNSIGVQAKKIIIWDKEWSYKRSWDTFIKWARYPDFINIDDIKLNTDEKLYIVISDWLKNNIDNPIKVSWLNKDYKFITFSELYLGKINNTTDTVLLGSQTVKELLSSETDSLRVSKKISDPEQFIKTVLSKNNVKMTDLNVYKDWGDLFIKAKDISKATNLFSIKTMESDIVFEDAIKQLNIWLSTDVVQWLIWIDTKRLDDLPVWRKMLYERLLDSRRTLEYILEKSLTGQRIPSDKHIQLFYSNLWITKDTLIQVDDVLKVTFWDMYNIGNVFRTTLRDVLWEYWKMNKSVKLENICCSYDIAKEYEELLYSLPSNDKVMIWEVDIISYMSDLMKLTKDNPIETTTQLYNKMLESWLSNKDMREGMAAVLQTLWLRVDILEPYIYQTLFPTIDIFRVQQVADWILSAVWGKDKQILVKSFNQKIKPYLVDFYKTNFWTDTHLFKFIEWLQQLWYVWKDINIFSKLHMLWVEWDKLKSNLRTIYSWDIIRILNDSNISETQSSIYWAISDNISKVIDIINIWEKYVYWEQIVEDWLRTVSTDKLLSSWADEWLTEFMNNTTVAKKRDLDFANIALSFKKNIDSLIDSEVELLKLQWLYSTTGKRDIVWSDSVTYKTAIMWASLENKNKVIELFKGEKWKTRRVEDLYFSRAIRWWTKQWTAKTKVSEDIFRVLNWDYNKVSWLDSYNIIKNANVSSEHQFIEQIKPEFFFRNQISFKPTPSVNLDSHKVIWNILDSILILQKEMAETDSRWLKNIDKRLFTMVTDSGLSVDIATDWLIDFPVWKWYINRLKTANPHLFEWDISEQFVFKQIEQLQKYINNVILDISSKTDIDKSVKIFWDSTALLKSENKILNTYTELKKTIDQVMDNYSNMLWIGEANKYYTSSMWEAKVYASQLESAFKFINVKNIIDEVKQLSTDFYKQKISSIKNIANNYSQLKKNYTESWEKYINDLPWLVKYIEHQFTKDKHFYNMNNAIKWIYDNLTTDGQKLFESAKEIELIWYTPIIEYVDWKEVIGIEKAKWIVDILDMDDYIDSLPWQFIWKREMNPFNFWIEQMDFSFRIKDKNWKTFEINTADNSVKEVKLSWWFKKVEEKVSDIDTVMDTTTAKEYQNKLDTFTC